MKFVVLCFLLIFLVGCGLGASSVTLPGENKPITESCITVDDQCRVNDCRGTQEACPVQTVTSQKINQDTQVEILDGEGDGIEEQIILFDSDNDGKDDEVIIDTDDDGLLDTWLRDSNNDGIVDIYEKDTNGDALADAWSRDTDYDGYREEYQEDRNGDGEPDYWSIDRDQDGKPEIIYRDTDGDGIEDRVSKDTDGDGEMDIVDQKYTPGVPISVGGSPPVQTTENRPKQDQDTTGDGKVDTWVGDQKGDGKIDTWFMDTDGDGVADLVEMDTTGDGQIDTWIIDRDFDGKGDTTYTDEDGDGVPDKKYEDDQFKDIDTGILAILIDLQNNAPSIYNCYGCLAECDYVREVCTNDGPLSTDPPVFV